MITVLSLLDPVVWRQISHEEHADLFVSWDALALPTMGRPLANTGRWLGNPMEEVHSWTEAWEVEKSYWREIEKLPAPVIRCIVREIAAVLLEPPLRPFREARTPKGEWRPPVGSGLTTQWLQWVMELEIEEAWYRNGKLPLMRTRTPVYLIEGIYSRRNLSEHQHHLPCFRYTTWTELLHVLQWITTMAWLSHLQGEL